MTLPPTPALPASVLSLVLSHLTPPHPTSLLLVSRLFYTLLSTHVTLSTPSSFLAYLGTSPTSDQPRPAWSLTTSLALHIGGWSDGLGAVWIPRMAYLLDGAGEKGLGAEVRRLEVSFGGEGWVGQVGQVIGGWVAKGALPKLEEVVLGEFVCVPKETAVVSTKQPSATTKTKGRRGRAPTPEPVATLPSDLVAPTAASLKFLSKLLATTSSSSDFQTPTLALSHLVHPSSPLSSSSPPAYITRLVVLPPASADDDDADGSGVQQLVDWLEAWLVALAGTGGRKTRGTVAGKMKGKKRTSGVKKRVLDLRALSECVEEEGMGMLAELVNDEEGRWEVLV